MFRQVSADILFNSNIRKDRITLLDSVFCFIFQLEVTCVTIIVRYIFSLDFDQNATGEVLNHPFLFAEICEEGTFLVAVVQYRK